MPWSNLAEAANAGRSQIQAESEHLQKPWATLLEIRDRGETGEQSERQVQGLYKTAGKALRKWAETTEQALDSVGQSYLRSRNVLELDETQALWELLDQIGLDIGRYVEDSDSVLENYEPLQRAAARTTLQPFWQRYQNVFDILGAYRDTLAIYMQVRTQQPISEVRRYEQDRREDSKQVRARLSEFVTLAKPLMQALRNL
jgi:hypothetical protein